MKQKNSRKVQARFGVGTKKGKLIFFIYCPDCKNFISMPLANVEKVIAKGKAKALKKQRIPRYISRSPKFVKDAGEWVL